MGNQIRADLFIKYRDKIQPYQSKHIHSDQIYDTDMIPDILVKEIITDHDKVIELFTRILKTIQQEIKKQKEVKNEDIASMQWHNNKAIRTAPKK